MWTDAAGTRHFRMLTGPFDSPESKEAFARLQLELTTSPLPSVVDPSAITVADLLLAYVRHAESYYRGPDGEPGDENRHVRTVCRAVRELYGLTAAAEFGPLALKAV